MPVVYAKKKLKNVFNIFDGSRVYIYFYSDCIFFIITGTSVAYHIYIYIHITLFLFFIIIPGTNPFEESPVFNYFASRTSLFQIGFSTFYIVGRELGI